MLKNYIKITLRNLLKNKTYVIINVVGLGLALACCIVAYLNSKLVWDFDKHHTQIDHIFKVHNQTLLQGDLYEYGRVPMPMADAIRNDIPGIDRVFRFEAHTFTVRDVNQDKVFDTRVCYADPGFMESFTFTMLSGDAKAYFKPEQAVITREYARKFYENDNPIGKVLTVFDDTGMSFNFVISGVVEEPPVNSSVHFDILVNFENRFKMYDDAVKGNWGATAQATFVYLENPEKASTIDPLLEPYVDLYKAVRPDIELYKFFLVPMATHAKNADEMRSEILPRTPPKEAIITPQVMAILILLVACFNFTNTAIANSNRRLKEIGVRKVLGGTRRQLIKQFMTENLTVCLLALIVGICIAIYLVPAWAAMWDDDFIQELSLTSNPELYGFLVLLLLLTTLLAGFYPSLYISAYKPVNILRGSVSIKGTGRITKVLLGIQYSFTVIALFASMAFIQNARYQDSIDLGFDRNQIIAVNLLNNTQFEKIEASMLANPDITNVATAKHHIGQSNYSLTLKSNEQEEGISMLDVGMGYPETMGLELIQGRSFSEELEASDDGKAILVNEKMVKTFGWEDPIGQRLSYNDSSSLTVVGVVKNFYLYGFWQPIEPVGLRLKNLDFKDDGTYSYIAAKTNINNLNETYDYLEDEWNTKIPNKVFEGFYQEDLLQEARKVNNNILIIFVFLGSIALILSCLGLFTMVSINLIKRTKEIGVRKVLGGSVQQMVFLVSKGYFWLLFIATVIGTTLGYIFIDGLISSIFNVRKPIDIYTIIIPGITVILISLLIAGLRTIKSAVVNPANSLRYE